MLWERKKALSVMRLGGWGGCATLGKSEMASEQATFGQSHVEVGGELHGTGTENMSSCGSSEGQDLEKGCG